MSTISDSNAGLDFELNLAPIIDCLTVLITFTMISASFLSISVFDAGMAGPIDKADKTPPPPVNLSLELRSGGQFDIVVTGKENTTVKVAAINGERDYVGLAEHLKKLKAKWPTVQGVSVEADENVEYQFIVKAMDSARPSFPEVVLGGM